MFDLSISQHHAGWHDAMRGEPCRSTDLAYRLGYRDASR